MVFNYLKKIRHTDICNYGFMAGDNKNANNKFGNNKMGLGNSVKLIQKMMRGRDLQHPGDDESSL